MNTPYTNYYKIQIISRPYQAKIENIFHSYKNIYPREQLPASGAGVLRAARGGGGVGHGADGGHGLLRLQEGGQDLQGDREVRQTRRAQQQVGNRVIYMMAPS